MTRRAHIDGYPRGAEYDQVVAEVMQDHLMRLDVADHVPMTREEAPKHRIDLGSL
jgi:hypothetical protein